MICNGEKKKNKNLFVLFIFCFADTLRQTKSTTFTVVYKYRYVCVYRRDEAKRVQGKNRTYTQTPANTYIRDWLSLSLFFSPLPCRVVGPFGSISNSIVDETETGRRGDDGAENETGFQSVREVHRKIRRRRRRHRSLAFAGRRANLSHTGPRTTMTTNDRQRI